MMFDWKNVGVTYQHLLKTMNDQDSDIVKESLCNPETKWMESDKSYEKTLLRMDLSLEAKIWYQFIKHPLRPTTHNETLNKARVVLLHCNTTFSTFNVAKIIVQEIHACSKKNDEVI